MCIYMTSYGRWNNVVSFYCAHIHNVTWTLKQCCFTLLCTYTWRHMDVERTLFYFIVCIYMTSYGRWKNVVSFYCAHIHDVIGTLKERCFILLCPYTWRHLGVERTLFHFIVRIYITSFGRWKNVVSFCCGHIKVRWKLKQGLNSK